MGSMTNQGRRNTQLKLDLTFEGYKNNVFFIPILIPRGHATMPMVTHFELGPNYRGEIHTK